MRVSSFQINLYDELPNTKEDITLGDNIPVLYPYIPQESRRDKVFIIIPGGGYTHLGIAHEGHQVAEMLCNMGYVAYVLKYRIPTKRQHLNRSIVPLQDAQKSMLLVAEEIKKMGIHNPRIGVIGFSAGGHLAATLATCKEVYLYGGNAKIGDIKPNFTVLIYPVISMKREFTHLGSRVALIGEKATEKDVKYFSAEEHVGVSTPPAFLVHAKDDCSVSIRNSYLYQETLNRNNIPNYLFTYEIGGHGFGLENTKEPRDWFHEMINWVENLD